MTDISREFLAALAQSNSQVLNDKPLRREDYDFSFDLDGVHYVFKNKDGYWSWSYEQK